jgi:hypothetical protein
MIVRGVPDALHEHNARYSLPDGGAAATIGATSRLQATNAVAVTVRPFSMLHCLEKRLIVLRIHC